MSNSSTCLTDWELAEGAEPHAFLALGAPQPVGVARPDSTDLDARAWLYRCRFTRPPAPHTELRLPPLGTLATVTLNGAVLLRSDNAHRAHAIDVGPLLRDNNLLEIAIAPLAPELLRKRPRPRWKTRITPYQNLRFVRTSLYGRMPGWTPPQPFVGLGGPVTLAPPAPKITRLCARYVQDGGGVVELEVEGGAGTLHVGDHAIALTEGRAALVVPDARAWWPHTHGAPTLYRARYVENGNSTELSPVGFRALAIDRDADGHGFGLVVNGVPIFCRGASWMPVAPDAPDAVARALDGFVAAGLNLVRLSGTIGYETDAFYAACAARGLLVWQDFAFANLDYPEADADFRAACDAEADELLRRLGGNPSVVVLCGGSETAQQASMMGLPADHATSPLFGLDGVLARRAAQHRPDVPYLPSTPWGGARPFVVDEGVGHYYGVGAYLRPLADARHARVRFAVECLAFANVPEPASIERLLGPGEVAPQHARWKAGVPADRGVGWDFDDVRDHYVGTLFDVDVPALRYADPERYLELGRVAIGEVMGRTFAEWRRPGSSCRGALVWYAHDLARGPGLGLVDVDGQRKSVWYYARRALLPLAVLLVDEGSNGLKAHIVNDLDQPWSGALQLHVGRRPALILEQHTVAVACPARGAITIDVEAAIGRFFDAAYSYRFGPPGHDVITATLLAGDAPVARATCAAWRLPLGAARSAEVALAATAARDGDAVVATVRASAWRSGVTVRADGWDADDAYFTLRPGEQRAVRLVANRPGARFAGELFALEEPHPIGVAP